MDTKKTSSEDHQSPSIQAFKDWASKPPQDTPVGSLQTGRLDKPSNEMLMAAQLSEGETVLCIGACSELGPSMLAKAVGPSGQVIAIIPKKSNTPEAAQLMKCNIPNVRCIESSMVTIEVRDGTTDCAISNVLANHVPAREMQDIFEELHRVLAPGGRVVVTDMMLRKEVPDSIRHLVPAACNVLKTGVQTAVYETHLKNAGFEAIDVKDTRKDVNVCVLDRTPEGHTPTGQHPEPSGIQDGQQSQYGQHGTRKEDNKSGSYRHKVGKFTRSLVAGQDDKEEKSPEDVDWNEYFGIFLVHARKPQ